MARSLGSRAPQVMLATVLAGACYSVYYAHHQQRAEKQVMRAGVIRDIKRDRMKQRELEQQRHQEQQSAGEAAQQ